MKNFLTSMLGALAALAIFSLGALVLAFGFVGFIATLGGGDKTPALENGSYLVFDLSANITDAPAGVEIGPLTIIGGGRALQLHNLTRAIRLAASDKRVLGILLKGSLQAEGYGSGYAALHEVRAALGAFRASGKPLKAYLTSASTKDYYLASMAGDIALDPYGIIEMPGLASEPMFYAGAFEKYGVGVQVTRVGKYKSAIEPYTRKDMSPENREELQKLLDDIWNDLVGQMAESRKLTAPDIQAVVDREGLIRPETAKAAKLIDRISYIDEVISDLRNQTGPSSEKKETFKQMPISEYARIVKGPDGPAAGPEADAVEAKTGKSGGRGKLAVIYAEGEIVDGEGGMGEIGGAKYAREIRALRQDSSIKAIVLRVNSPGGSATASEAIQREIRLAREAKPVVVSMGSYAASGGYWISAYGQRIFAEPTTITGSIGVFGVQFDIQKLANNLGITFDSVKTGRFADMATISRPKTDAEIEVVQKLVDWIYGEFVDKVAEGRNLKRDVVESIAQGRVWSGAEAQKLGLVDEIGGLPAALSYAATRAGLGANYELVEYPRKKDLSEAITDLLGDLNPNGTRAPRGAAEAVVRRFETELKMLSAFNDPSGLYARLPFNLSIR